MEKWQEVAIAKVYKINFIEKEAEIKQAFKELCEPLIGINNITVEEDRFYVGRLPYELTITEDSIKISYKDSGIALRECYFNVNSANKYAYHFEDRHLPNYESLHTINFDYKNILNNLFNYIFLGIKSE